MLIQRKFQINWSDISFGKIKRIGGVIVNANDQPGII